MDVETALAMRIEIETLRQQIRQKHNQVKSKLLEVMRGNPSPEVAERVYKLAAEWNNMGSELGGPYSLSSIASASYKASRIEVDIDLERLYETYYEYEIPEPLNIVEAGTKFYTRPSWLGEELVKIEVVNGNGSNVVRVEREYVSVIPF